jgi:hypothetical protein
MAPLPAFAEDRAVGIDGNSPTGEALEMVALVALVQSRSGYSKQYRRLAVALNKAVFSSSEWLPTMRLNVSHTAP